MHNLHAYAWGRQQVEPYDWAVRFEERARELILAADHQPLVECETLGRDARLSMPTPDHYLPLLYVLALQCEGDEISFPVGDDDICPDASWKRSLQGRQLAENQVLPQG